MTCAGNKKRRAVYRDQYRYVLLQIHSNKLDPQTVTKKLGIEPTWSTRRGTYTTPGGRTFKHAQGSWSIATQLRRNASLEKHVRNVWDRIAPRKTALKLILKDARGTLTIAVRPHPEVVNSMYMFPSEVIAKFVGLGIDIVFSIIDPHNWEAMCRE